MTEKMLTVAQIAGHLGLCKMTVYRLIHAGRLPAIQVGRSYRIKQSTFDRYLKEARTDEGTRNVT